MDDYRFIQVEENSNKKLHIYNPTSLPLIGQGSQGAVFKLDDNRCIKIYADKKIADMEKNSYAKGAGAAIMPLLYETGPKYIIIEYIKGPNLKEYLLQKGKMTEDIARELINMFYEMKSFGFLRQDESLRHILLKDNKKIKIVDHTYAFTLKNPVPVKLFKQLDAIGMLRDFIEQGTNEAPLLFREFSEKMPEYFFQP